MASSDRRPNVGPLERGLSLAAGAAALSLALRRRSPVALLLGAAGGYLVLRGASGRCRLYRSLGVSASEVGRTVTVCSQITVQRSAGEVYRFWRDPENVPRFSSYLESVRASGDGRWHCRARTAWGDGDFDVRATVDEAGRRLAWCVVEGASVPGALEVRLEERGPATEIFVDAWLVPPAGPLVSAALRQADRSRPLRRAGLTPSQLLQQELRRLRQVLETGHTATVQGQSSGRSGGTGASRPVRHGVGHSPEGPRRGGSERSTPGRRRGPSSPGGGER